MVHTWTYTTTTPTTNPTNISKTAVLCKKILLILKFYFDLSQLKINLGCCKKLNTYIAVCCHLFRMPLVYFFWLFKNNFEGCFKTCVYLLPLFEILCFIWFLIMQRKNGFYFISSKHFLLQTRLKQTFRSLIVIYFL